MSKEAIKACFVVARNTIRRRARAYRDGGNNVALGALREAIELLEDAEEEMLKREVNRSGQRSI